MHFTSYRLSERVFRHRHILRRLVADVAVFCVALMGPWWLVVVLAIVAVGWLGAFEAILGAILFDAIHVIPFVCFPGYSCGEWPITVLILCVIAIRLVLVHLYHPNAATYHTTDSL